MNMLSSHRIRPSIVSGFNDHGLDQSSMNSPSHHVMSDRANISNERSSMLNDRPSMSIDRPSMLNDRISFSNDRSSFANERSSFVNDRPSFTNERSSFTNDRSRITNDRPSMLNDRPNTSADRPNVTKERSMANKRTNFSNERSNLPNDRQSIPSDRSNMSNGRHNASNERPYVPDGRPTISIDRPIERPTISIDRPTDRPTISIERPTERPTISIDRPTDRPSISTERPNMTSERSMTPNDRGRQSKSPHNPNMVAMVTDRQPMHPTSFSKTTIFRGEILRGPNDTLSRSESREYNGRYVGQRNIQPQTEPPSGNVDDDSIQPRSLQDNSHNNRHIYHMHPSMMSNKSPKLSENHTQVYNNYSMVSTNSVRPIMVPATTPYEQEENRFDVKSSQPQSHVSEHADTQRFDKSRWKNYNFIDKSVDYLTSTSVSKSVISSDSPGKQKYTISHTHSSIPYFPHSNLSDKLPTYNSVLKDKASMSPKSPSYTDDTDNSMFLEKPNMPEKNMLSIRQSDRQYMVSRSPSSIPEQALDKPELIRKSYMSPDVPNNSNDRPPMFPAKRSFYSRSPSERYHTLSEQPVSMVSQNSYSPDKSEKVLQSEMPVSSERSTTSIHSQAFLSVNSTAPERASMLPIRPPMLPKSNSSSPDIPSMPTRSPPRLSDMPSMLSEKPRMLPSSPVMINSNPSLPDKLPTMSEIQPLYSGNSNYNDRPTSISERSELSHSPSLLTVRPNIDPPISSMLHERPPIVTEMQSILTGSQSFTETESMEFDKSPVLSNLPITSEIHSNGHLSPNYYLANENGNVERSLDPSPHSHDNSTANFNELSEEEEREGSPTSPVPPVVILNTEEATSDDDVASSGEVADYENDNTFTDPNNGNGDGDSPISMCDRPLLSSERPSMLSDSPSMVSAISVRPSMISSDGTAEDNMAISSALTSPSDKSNVVKRGKRKKYQKYTPADRIAIGKFCFEHGPAAARKAFQSRYPEMSESVTRGFRDKYKLMIGEYAVYVFEQKRRREMHVRTESLPRGRPRKYKQIEVGEKNNLPATPTTPVSVSPQFQPAVSTSPEPKPINYDDVKEEKNEDEEEDQAVSKKEYTREEKLIIGWFCAKHGGEIALNVFSEEHPDLTLEMVVAFHKMYIESEGQVAEKDQANVFVVEVDNSTVQSPPSSTGSITTQPEVIQNDASSPNESSEMALMESPEDRKSCERELDSISRSDDVSSNNSEIADTVSPVISAVSRSVVTIPVSPHTVSPIIHYPKISSEGVLRVHQQLEQREFKQEYSSKMEPNGDNMGYPYDRPIYMYADESMANGSSSLPRTKRFKYQKYSPEDRYNIGKLCNDIGLGATVKVYREQFPRLNESVVRTFRNKYRELLQKGNGIPVTEAIQRKPSRRSITTLIESEVVSQLRQFKQSNIDITEKLVIAVAENIIATKDQKDIGPVKNTVTKEWASSLLWKHKLVERQVSNPNGVCCERCKTPLVCPKC